MREKVRQKYGSAARAVAETGKAQACCDPGLRCCDPITTNLYSADEKGLIPEKAVRASLGCGNPTALIELQAGRDGAGPGVGGRHRRAALGAARGPHGQGLRPGHDRRDAGAGAREPAAGGRGERRVPEGRDREHSAAGRFGGRDHLQLRDQSFCGQGPRAAGGVSRAEAGRAVRGFRCGGARRGAGRGAAKACCCGSGCIAGALEENDYLREADGGGVWRGSSWSRRASTTSRTRASF